jgi:hypothetical protein
MPFVNTARMMARAMAKKRLCDRICQAHAKRRRTRSTQKFANVKDELRKQMAEKAVGLQCGSGMNMENEEGQRGAPNEQGSRLRLLPFD